MAELLQLCGTISASLLSGTANLAQIKRREVLEMQLQGIVCRIQELEGGRGTDRTLELPTDNNVARRISYGAGAVGAYGPDDTFGATDMLSARHDKASPARTNINNTRVLPAVGSSSAGRDSYAGNFTESWDDPGIFERPRDYHNHASSGNYANSENRHDVDIHYDDAANSYPPPEMDAALDKLCNCGLPCIRRISTVAKSLDQAFYCCQHPKSSPENCGFFEWEDETGQSSSRYSAEYDNQTIDAPPVFSTSMKDYRRELKDRFGHNQFREGQKKCVEAALKGQDVFCLMPTGGGKSIVYQVSCLLLLVYMQLMLVSVCSCQRSVVPDLQSCLAHCSA
jgi:hypothetical protein